jgi:hypothetical protein
MEVLTLFGLSCLTIILLLGISKRRRGKKLGCTIARIEKRLSEVGEGCLSRQDLGREFKDELRVIADTAGSIHVLAILENARIERLIRSLPESFVELDRATRVEILLSRFAWARRVGGQEANAEATRPDEDHIPRKIEGLYEDICPDTAARAAGGERYTSNLADILSQYAEPEYGIRLSQFPSIERVRPGQSIILPRTETSSPHVSYPTSSKVFCPVVKTKGRFDDQFPYNTLLAT